MPPVLFDLQGLRYSLYYWLYDDTKRLTEKPKFGPTNNYMIYSGVEVHPNMEMSCTVVFKALGRMVNIQYACNKSFWIQD